MIHWDIQKVQRFGQDNQAQRCVWATCDLCHTGRWCTVSNARRAKTGLCTSCYRKVQAGQDLQAEKHGKWKGGRVVHSGGYIYIHIATLAPDERHLFKEMADKKGYILEHRLVAARQLGRPLIPTEIAHHENGKLDDNRPENIRVFATVGDHVRYHAKLRAASTG